jgi:hypothetical protein
MATALAYSNNLLRMGNMAFAMLTPPSPFDVVSDSDFNASYQLTYDSIPDYAGYQLTGDPQSMLYRKVKVNKTVIITKFSINTNVSPVSVSGSLKNLTKPGNLSPAYGAIWDLNLNNRISLNCAQGSPYGQVTQYKEQSTGNNWSWYFLMPYCNVTLQPGTYWWPVFVQRHANKGLPKTQFGYHSTLDCDLMMLYKYNDVSDTTHPPIFTTITNARPYLHLWDSDGNEYSV